MTSHWQSEWLHLTECVSPPQVDQTFEVRGVGCVLSGTVVAGRVTLGQQLRLGPDDRGAFKDVTVTCIQREQVRPLCYL